MRHPARQTAAALLTTAALASAGCGSTSVSAPKTPASSSPAAAKKAGKVDQACSVLSVKLAARLFGGPAKRTRKAQPNPQETTCTYNDEKGGSIAVSTGSWTIIKELAGGPGAKPVHGLGDAALASATGLAVRKGEKGLAVDAFTRSGSFSGGAAAKANDSALAFERRIAKALVPRL